MSTPSPLSPSPPIYSLFYPDPLLSSSTCLAALERLIKDEYITALKHTDSNADNILLWLPFLSTSELSSYFSLNDSSRVRSLAAERRRIAEAKKNENDKTLKADNKQPLVRNEEVVNIVGPALMPSTLSSSEASQFLRFVLSRLPGLIRPLVRVAAHQEATKLMMDNLPSILPGSFEAIETYVLSRVPRLPGDLLEVRAIVGHWNRMVRGLLNIQKEEQKQEQKENAEAAKSSDDSSVMLCSIM